MRSVVGVGLDWLGRLWRRETPSEGAWDAEVRPVVEAVGTVEAMVCDAVAHRPLEPAGARRADRAAGSGTVVHNAFGRPIVEIDGSSAAGAVAAATGLALTGLRSTAWLRAAELPGALPALRGAAERLAPTVLHVVADQEGARAGHDGYHAAADAGWFQVFAHSGQHAVDLALLARWVTERALVPGLVAEDGLAIDDVRVPPPEAVRELLGWPDDHVPSPTEAQRLVFGPERRRVQGWFDPDHPMAVGEARDPVEAAAAAAGRERFYTAHLRTLAVEGMAAVGALTGRPLHFVDTWGLDDCDRVIVAQGGLVEAARAVADHARRTRRLRVGVVGITWLRPFPSAEIAEALRGREAVAVLERTTATGAPPLFREVAAALGGETAGWISAVTAEAPTPESLIDLYEVLRRPDRPPRVRLDRAAAAQAGLRREALDLAVGHAYPDDAVPPSGARWPVQPGSVAVVGLDTDLQPAEPADLAAAMAKKVGPVVRGALAEPVPGVRLVRLAADVVRNADAGPGAPSALLVVLSDPRRIGAWPARVAPGGAVLLAGFEEPPPPLPGAWVHRIREDGLTVHVAPREGWVDLAATWAEDAPDPVPAGAITAAGQPGSVPAIVERIASERRAPDSLPRFWGEQLAPRLTEGPEAPDPVAAAGVVPGLATALVAAPSASLPVLDASRCTGCGLCWAACPDSAIGVSVLPVEALLTAASRRAATQGPQADALRRAHKHLASRIAGPLGKGEAGGVPEAAWRDAFAWVVDRLGVSAEDQPGWNAAFEATLAEVVAVDPVVTEPFFFARERDSKGTGDLLVWAVDPRACQGCGLCVAECPEEALSIPATPDVVAARARRARWEALPDTPGPVVARAWEGDAQSALAAVTLSRHCAEAQVGGGTTEPGSGERLATRAVAAVAEYHGQRRQAGLLEDVTDTRAELERWVREQLVASLSGADDSALAEALQGGGSLDLAELAGKLASRGVRAKVDRALLQRATHLAERLAATARRLSEGADGLGRARFGVVAASCASVDALLRFPEHPFFAPVVVDGSPQTLDLARGVAEGLVSAHLEVVRAVRAAELLVRSPRDRDDQLKALESLQWEGLDPDERASCPPLVLLADDTLLPEGLGFLGRLVQGVLPVKLVLLDGLSLERAVEPALVALAHRDLFCVAGSVGYPDALARDVLAAFEFPGPALIHVQAPSPKRHGFAPEETLAQARAAVAARAHVLLRYDPAAAGTFGTRLDLSANPDPDGEADPEALRAWAVSQARFAGRSEEAALSAWVERRLATWRTLREIGGDASPFVDRIREGVRAELRAAHEAEVAALRAEHARALEEVKANRDQEAVQRLTRHLMTLAGHPGGES